VRRYTIDALSALMLLTLLVAPVYLIPMMFATVPQ
jgi:hypothetical protein